MHAVLGSDSAWRPTAGESSTRCGSGTGTAWKTSSAPIGLVLNAVVLWNTGYTDAALTALREQGHPVLEADAAWLSPLVDSHLNVHGRYSFIPPVLAALRPLRDVTKADED